jgi:hypothetical protein
MISSKWRTKATTTKILLFWNSPYLAVRRTTSPRKCCFAEYLNGLANNNIVQRLLNLFLGRGRLTGGKEESTSCISMTIPQQREKVFRLGVHWSLTNLMGQREENVTIQIYCCSILRDLLLEGRRCSEIPGVLCSGTGSNDCCYESFPR